ncbi:Peptidyl-prolyl cis-trans isomerase NIMA-interacting protein 1 [Mycoemilia scoparia]|uniref:Peptidyl-prolyl cis-trans isomerase n=1 Tax=Mycoemilia scoparia TaxID=417184 RepID=A0A9W7ZSF4_9FUNG|nr:Peptidyl-prolyl cis-trans isomerase NIMA-interacting protein 1 [Mycoemilia scoparia]
MDVPAHQSALPPNWIVRMSKSRKLPYYYNTQTGKSQWTPPDPSETPAAPTTTQDHQQQQQTTSNNATSGGGKIRVSHLLVKHAESRRPSSWKQAHITRTKQEALELIEGYQEDIENGDATLEKLARTQSDCSSARNGGDLEWFGRGQMQPAFEQAAFALNVGELSKPVWSDSGVHLILRTG